MAFTGTYEVVDHRDNQEFIQSIGVSAEDAEDRAVSRTEILQDGDDFVWNKCTRRQTHTLKFTLNKECDLHNFNGVDFRGTAVLVGDKVVLQFPSLLYIAAVCGDKLIEVRGRGGGGAAG
ncbi:gastrotropin-like [Centroberyx gerrardi]